MNKLNSSWEDVLSRHVWRRRGAWLLGATDIIALLWDGKDPVVLRKRAVAAFLATTICLHVLLIWLLLRSVSAPMPPLLVQASELAVSLSPTPSKPDPVTPAFQTPSVADIQEPQIEIAPQTDASNAVADASGATGIPETIAPRPDPTHQNPQFSVPRASSGLRIVLRALIAANGGVDSAQISQSCGQPTLDQAAIKFIKAYWKFQPATTGGIPVPFWTTILVPVVEA